MPTYDQRDLDALTELQLDPHNPRLRKDEEGSSQAKLVAIMLSRFKIEEVADSIIAAGWLEQDPMIAVEEDGETRIVEGNRRLTAIKLLLDPDLAPDERVTRWRSMSNALDEATRDSIRTLSVRVYRSRDDPHVSSYIGFRHVTGVLPWPALEKASYIARLASQGLSYEDLADKLGSYPSHMQRHHVAHQMVEQAEEWELDGARQLGDAFGVLLRALQTEGVRRFLDLAPSTDPNENLRPVPQESRQKFADFIRWTFGTATQARVLPESRELTKWSKILLSAPAVRYLTHAEEPRFDRAWARSGGESESLTDALWKASYLLAEVLPLLSDHKDEDAVREAAAECARFMQKVNALMSESAAPRA